MGRSIDLPAPTSTIDDVLGTSSEIHLKESELVSSDHDKPSSVLLIYRPSQWLFVLLGNWLFIFLMTDTLHCLPPSQPEKVSKINSERISSNRNLPVRSLESAEYWVGLWGWLSPSHPTQSLKTNLWLTEQVKYRFIPR